MWKYLSCTKLHEGVLHIPRFLNMDPNVRGALGGGLRGTVQQYGAIILTKTCKLKCKPLDEGPREPTSQKRHNSSCYNMVRHVKHLDNGLTFMPVQCTCVMFLLFLYEGPRPRIGKVRCLLSGIILERNTNGQN